VGQYCGSILWVNIVGPKWGSILGVHIELSEQLEKKTQAIAMLKHEVKLREDLLKKAQTELKEANSNNTVKVDRYLVKNLVVGYVNADEGKRQEILKIVATVLDFNQEEWEKTGLDGQPSSWLGSFFASPAQQQRPHHQRTNSTDVHKATGLDLTLAQAFVAFLPTARSAVGLGITLCTFTPSIAPFGHLVIWSFGHLAIWSFYHFPSFNTIRR
jgi:hypothetical protein